MLDIGYGLMHAIPKIGEEEKLGDAESKREDLILATFGEDEEVEERVAIPVEGVAIPGRDASLLDENIEDNTDAELSR
jgi:hypothetical protein